MKAKKLERGWSREREREEDVSSSKVLIPRSEGLWQTTRERENEKMGKDRGE